MRKRAIVAAMVAGVMAADAEALVLCAPVSKKTGQIREGAPLRLRTACTAKEQQVDPDATGLRGPQGTAGTPGDPGTPGAPGLSDIEVVSQDGSAIISGYGTSSATASCPAGKKAVAGGHDFTALGPWTVYPWVVESRPVTSEPQGWTAAGSGQASDDWWIRTYVVCANATP